MMKMLKERSTTSVHGDKSGSGARFCQFADSSSSPHYFKRVKISSVALIKMVLHARSGVPYEVMGLMQGKLEGDTMIIMDAFALPVQVCW